MSSRSAGGFLLALLFASASCKQEPDDVPFVDTAYEPNNSRSTAASVGGGAGTYAVSAYLDQGDIDWFSVQIDAWNTLDLNWADGFAVKVYDSNGTYLPSNTSNGTIDIVTTGVYTIQVYFPAGSTVQTIYGFTLHGGKAPGPYTLKFSIAPTFFPDDDMGTHRDGANYSVDALPPAVLSGIGALTLDTDTADWFAIPVAANQWVTVTMTPPADADFELDIRTPTSIISAPSKGPGEAETITKRAASSGTWKIGVSLKSGEGVYQLNIVVQ